MNGFYTAELMIKEKHPCVWIFSTGRKEYKLRSRWKLNVWLVITIDYSSKALIIFFSFLSDPRSHVFYF